jgi:ribokinase
MGRVLVLGSTNMDLVLKSARLPKPGETVLGHTYLQAFGGKGANQAVAAARAGAEVTFISAVGDDVFGREAREQFGREGIRLEHLRVLEGRASGVALILVDDDGHNLISVFPGANGALGSREIEEIPDAVFRGPGVFVTQLETPVGAVALGLERARAGGRVTILNPAPTMGRAELAGALPFADIVIPNEFEAERLTGVAAHDEPGARAAAEVLFEHGCRAAIVTLGARGCVVVEREAGFRSTHIPGIPVKAIDTVAAGDAFVGAMACRLSEGSTIVDAARWATRAAAISVTRAGAQPSLARREEIESFNH